MKLGYIQRAMLKRLAQAIEPLSSAELYGEHDRSGSSHRTLVKYELIEDTSDNKLKRAWILTQKGKAEVNKRGLV